MDLAMSGVDWGRSRLGLGSSYGQADHIHVGLARTVCCILCMLKCFVWSLQTRGILSCLVIKYKAALYQATYR